MRSTGGVARVMGPSWAEFVGSSFTRRLEMYSQSLKSHGHPSCP